MENACIVAWFPDKMVLNDCIAALNKLLLTVVTVLAKDLSIDTLCSVVQLQENVKKALQTTGLAAAQKDGLKLTQYGDHVLNGPGQQFALQNPGSGQAQFPPVKELQLPPVDGFLDGPKQNPNGGFLLPVFALLNTLQFPGTTGFVAPGAQVTGLNTPQHEGALKFPQQKVPWEQLPTAF